MAEFHWISKCVSSDIRLPLSVSPRLQPTSGTALARAGHSVEAFLQLIRKLPKFARRKTRDQATQYPFGSFWTFSLCQFTGFNTPDSPRSSGILSFQCNFFFWYLHICNLLQVFWYLKHIFLLIFTHHCSCPEPGQQQLSRGAIAPGRKTLNNIQTLQTFLKRNLRLTKIEYAWTYHVADSRKSTISSALTLIVSDTAEYSIWSWLV